MKLYIYNKEQDIIAAYPMDAVRQVSQQGSCLYILLSNGQVATYFVSTIEIGIK